MLALRFSIPYLMGVSTTNIALFIFWSRSMWILALRTEVNMPKRVYTCFHCRDALQDTVLARGLGRLSPCIGDDCEVLVVLEEGLSQEQLLKAVAALPGGSYHHDGSMSIINLQRSLCTKQLHIVNAR